ncbi:MAG: pirin family protein [Gammaproteobacteria bacterium]|nr:pirin family protein [Gammaproteobacteria bacterium]MDH4256009.1 pirin family protein [Gammaproteobacteria bacterium]MDH5308725.1 pirin family protein [Gammaproteobacteria bacterium]
MTPTSDNAVRTVRLVTPGLPASDGAGVRMTRIIGTHALDHLDPFLLFDVFRSDDPDDYIAGFPPHPHRGFETVTYMFAGQMRHRDNAGNEGIIRPGGVQWMTAGRGIVHSEMPEQDQGLMWGTQLWVNLPAANKMVPPAYHEYPADEIPVETRDGDQRIAVIAGTTRLGTEGPVIGRPTAPIYLDIRLAAGRVFAEPLPEMHNAFAFVVQGRLDINGTRVDEGSLAVLGDGSIVEAESVSAEARFLLVSARALKEPIARGGPFVMNTQEELRRAFFDYQAGRF